MPKPTGVLLVNLGTPHSPKPSHVYRYLIEFLSDPRVIDFSWLKRQLLVRGLIVPFRYRNSAKSYAEIWTKEGSPLLVHSQNLVNALQTSLGTDYKIYLAMRYQSPSIKNILDTIKNDNLDRLIVLPLFPQYASATTGSVQQEVMKHLSQWPVIPKVNFINHFATHPKFIQAVAEIGKGYPLENYDHIIFSFHGLPESHIKKADYSGCCLKTNCCNKLQSHNLSCYKAQCHGTAQGIVQALQIPEGKYSITFQSRLGKEPWLNPFTSERLDQLVKENKKRVLVFSPAFVCDCLETLHEIAIEYKHSFIQQGGQTLDLVRGLNDHPLWVEAVSTIIKGR